ncbi:ArsI/CadI family heavy metal resistance metalloenzyme [Dyella psychrodurans]|uniref:Glyoxalase/bleomycin resistance/dioxygenase family protein n=1 Tax=Dyella psychrodurans TaxID=1927960 RepID=A0A370WZ55_9GAMM|nr:ArsI/CadI family heavy metal resistance metalloenzyme [Dyella psychrodurans]RDS81376.1 glyoxalase/bleomycin resistance/dioxygenase family protein [Dyella psychrodurans]
MNRFHVHLNVADLSSSVRFYTELFAAEPTVLKADYAKWMLENPRVNFAISNTGQPPGVDHLGIQVDSEADLAILGQQLDAAGGAVIPEEGATCCYAQSNKLWTEDPQGTRWETFHTLGEATTYYANQAGCGDEGVACAPVKPQQSATPTRSKSCDSSTSGCC